MPNSVKAMPNLLGDVTSSEDDSSLIGSIESSGVFHSPQRNDDGTDYGLEYTNTNIGSPLINIGSVGKKIAIAPTTTTKTVDTAQNPPPPVKEKTVPVTVKKKRKQGSPKHRDKIFINEVRKLQAQKNFLIPRLPFSRLVREILMHNSADGIKVTRTALEALQETSEMYLTQQLQDAYTLTLHRGRVTLSANDMELLRFIRGRY